MNSFTSGFASRLNAMLEFRVTRGFKSKSHLASLLRFDKFCAERYPDESQLTPSIVYDWLDAETALVGQSMLNAHARAIRQFGVYLVAVDEDTFVLTEKFAATKRRETPYNFTDSELTALFSAIDRLPPSKNEPFWNEIAPVLYRLTYTCGLRPNESRSLLCENMDLKSGIITIVKAKGNKDRIVVMSGDMLKMCRKYNKKRSIFSGDNPYFFPSNNGASFKSQSIQSSLTQAWTRAMCNKDCPIPPRVRVYDLRHRMASACLINWLDEGKDLMSMLPYLREHMGHQSLDETAYYIHILPENLLKSSAVDWDVFNAMFPEVPY